MVKKIDGRKSSNNFLVAILVILLLLVAVAVFLTLIGFKPLYAPQFTINDFMNDVKSSPASYTIAIADDASGDIVAVASDFASAFGITNSKLKSEISADTKIIYIIINTLLSPDYKVVYYADKDSLLVIGKTDSNVKSALDILVNFEQKTAELSNAGLSSSASVISILTCSDGTSYESCSVAKPKYCAVTSFDATFALVDKSDVCGAAVSGDAITASRTMPNSANVGDEITVSFSVTANRDVTSLAVGEVVPNGFVIVADSVVPDPAVQSGGTLLWTKSTFAKESSRTYTYKAKANTAGTFEFKGKAGVIDNGVEFNIQLNKQIIVSSVVVPTPTPSPTPTPICTENWQCGLFSSVSCVNGIKTRTCTDLNNCGTTTIRPPLTETCSVATTCSDTDNGLDIFTSGSVTVNGITSNDVCNAAGVTERACGENNVLVSQLFACAQCNTDGESCAQQTQPTPIPSPTPAPTPTPTPTPSPTPAPTPATIYDTLSSIEGNVNHGYRGAIGRIAQTIDSIGMIDIAGKFKIPQTKLDNQYTISNIQDNIIIVGGPCVNTLASELKSKGKFNFGCADWPGGGNFAVAQFIENPFGTGKNVIYIAGTRGEDTREITKIVKQYKAIDKESKFKAGARVCKASVANFCQANLGLSDAEVL